VTAHACRLGVAAQVSAVAASANAVSADDGFTGVATDRCAGHGASQKAAAGLCDVHCSDGTTPVTPSDLPAVALVPLPVTVATPAMLAAVEATDRQQPAALGGAPPPHLSFCRLLI
jgi:hypothetical protein